jgi:hypothetical protein
VSSSSSGGLHESTGLRSARQLSTPLLRCESRTNRLKANPLVKRRSKRKRGPSWRALFLFAIVRFWIACRPAASLAFFLHLQNTGGVRVI